MRSEGDRSAAHGPATLLLGRRLLALSLGVLLLLFIVETRRLGRRNKLTLGGLDRGRQTRQRGQIRDLSPSALLARRGGGRGRRRSGVRVFRLVLRAYRWGRM